MRVFIIFALLIQIISSFAFCADGKKTDSSLASSIKNINLITVEDLKNDFISYITFNESSNYEKIFKYLSKSIIKKYPSKIQNASDYKLHMKKTSERGPIEYTEVFEVVKEKKDMFKIGIIFNTIAEGTPYRIKTFYYFVFEQGNWKYDGVDHDNYTIID